MKDYNVGKEIRSWSVYIPDNIGDYLSPVLKEKWINTGRQEKRFREIFASKFDLPNVVACNSGTSALKATYSALGIGRGDEVVSTPYTFIATNTSILEVGATPVFADIDYDTLNVSPQSIADKITKKTKAIVCVHYGGNPCDMDAIWAIGRHFNIPVIEDSAHAMGSQYRGSYIGSRGDVATFSFQSVKIITSGDGGAVVTGNEGLYSKLKKKVFFGVDRDEKVLDILDPLPSDIDELGFKANMNDVVAVMAIAGLDNFDLPYRRRRAIGTTYRVSLKDTERVRATHYPEENTPNFQIFPVHVDDRMKFATFMRKNGIIVNVNNRRNDRYSIFGGKCDLPSLEKADNDTILIPMHAGLSNEDVLRVVSTIYEYEKL